MFRQSSPPPFVLLYLPCSHGFSDQTIASDCRVPSSSSVNKLRPHRRSRSLVGIFFLLTTRLGYKYFYCSGSSSAVSGAAGTRGVQPTIDHRKSGLKSGVHVQVRPWNSPEFIDSLDHRWRHSLIKKALSPSPSRRIGTVAKPTSSLSSVTSKPKEVCNLVLFPHDAILS